MSDALPSGAPPMPLERSGAAFSDDGLYRYSLWREWGDGLLPRALIVVGLNPSTADEFTDDPTIRRCVGFAKREGCGKLVMLNLFALRATDPKVMIAHPEPIGAANDATLRSYAVLAASLGDLIVAAWGVGGSHLNRAMEVRNLFAQAGASLRCLGRTASGAPRHPLYLKADSPLVTYEPV